MSSVYWYRKSNPVTVIAFFSNEVVFMMSFRRLIATLLLGSSFMGGIGLAQADKREVIPDEVLRIVDATSAQIAHNNKSLDEALKKIKTDTDEAVQAEFERLMKAGQLDIAGTVRKQQESFRRDALDPDFFHSRHEQYAALPPQSRGIFMKAFKESDLKWKRTHELNEKAIEDGKRALKIELDRLTRALLVNESFATRELFDAFRETVIRQVCTGENAKEKPLPMPRNRKFAGKWEGFEAVLLCDKAGSCTMTLKSSGRVMMTGKLAPWIGQDFMDKDFYHYRAEIKGSDGVSYRLQPNGDDELLVLAVARDGRTVGPSGNFRRAR